MRTKKGYKLRLMDRKKAVMTLANIQDDDNKKIPKSGKAFLDMDRLGEKVRAKDPSSRISEQVDHYLYL